MRTPLDRIRRGAIVLLGVVAASTLAYRLLGWDWLDSLYMVILTIATVGFTERSELSSPEQLVTIAVMLIGIGTAAYTLGGFLQMITAGELESALGQRRMKMDIEQLDKHTIICGYGRIGFLLAAQLRAQHEPFVVIEQAEERAAQARQDKCLVVHGNATEDDCLISAGIARSHSLVTALPDDADNVFITLSARNLNPQLQIIARAEQQSTEKKLVQAGATRVIAPATIGAQRIAAMITRPATIELVELFSGNSNGEIEIDELKVSDKSALVGKTLGESDARRRFKLLLVAIRRGTEDLVFNPDTDHQFQAGDTAIVMGRREDIDRFRGEFMV